MKAGFSRHKNIIKVESDSNYFSNGPWPQYEAEEVHYALKRVHRKILKIETDKKTPMQLENFRLEGKRIMPETRFTEFPALSVDARVGISRLCIRNQCLVICLTYDIEKYYLAFDISFIFDILCRITTFSERHSVFLVVPHVTSLIKLRILTSLLT